MNFSSPITEDQERLIPITRKMVKKAARNLTLAFIDYPMISYLFPNKKTRFKRSYRYFRGIINYGRMFGDSYAISEDAEGIAISLSPRMARFPFRETMRSGIPMMFALCGAVFLLRMKTQEQHQYNIYKKHTQFQHRYMMLLGVNPKMQGLGYARLLLNKILDESDTDNVPCYCETYLSKNVDIYKRFGFEVVQESSIPNTNIKFWGMVRKNSNDQLVTG